jgi:hypothetical protein
VPSALIGANVLLRVTGRRVEILEPFTGEIAADHALVEPAEVSIIDEHYGSHRRARQATTRGAAAHRRREAIPAPATRRLRS